MSTTRRSVLGMGLRSVTTLGALSLFKKSAQANPRRSSDQVVVSINLIGGNDSNNMVVPLGAEYDNYSRGRGELALSKSSLLPIVSSRLQGSYGLHPSLGELRGLYETGALAIVANIGSLTSPLSRAQVLANSGLPSDLMQHTHDSRWKFVWPGFTVPTWTEGMQGLSHNSDGTEDPMETFGFSSGLAMVPGVRTKIEGPSMNNPKLIQAMKGAAPFRTFFPSTGLGKQLLQAAQLLQVSESLGLKRPVFSTSLAGFDTHRDQLPKQAELFAVLSEAMAAFYEATRELGIADRVATYTDTEFNRTLAPNATHGSEHGWGGHQLVMGGGISGGDIVGDFPSLALGGTSDAGSRGVWIPTTASHQFHATLAERYGLRSGEVARLIPEARNFAPSTLQL
jgi:uncharacterized protein (DUF1501 family)